MTKMMIMVKIWQDADNQEKSHLATLSRLFPSLSVVSRSTLGSATSTSRYFNVFCFTAHITPVQPILSFKLTSLPLCKAAFTPSKSPSLQDSIRNMVLVASLLASSCRCPGKICQFSTSFCQMFSPTTSVRKLFSLEKGELGS